MKSFIFTSVIFIFILGGNAIFAQDDDVPYLSEEDIAAIEMTLPDDVPAILQEIASDAAAEAKENIEVNEISRINSSQRIYHLLILDRTYSSVNSDISGIDNSEVLYKFRHGTNGYLIAIYTSPQGGPVFPQFPDRSRILVELMSVRKSTIKDYVNSSAFRRFVTNRIIINQIQRVLDSN
jgi:hypothetical protein